MTGGPLQVFIVLAIVCEVTPRATTQQVAPPAALAPLPTGSGTIQGRVAERDSNLPLSGALVRLLSADLQRSLITETDSQGAYSFDAIAPGDYRIVVTHAGYVDQAYGAPDVRMARIVPEAVVTLEAHSAVRVNLSMARAASISGVVIAEGGRPLREVNVSLTVITERGIRVSRWSATTDANGEYRLSNLPQGNFQVSVIWDQEDSLGNRRRSREIYYPGTDNPEQANVIALTPGVNLRDIDIAVPLSSLLLIQGTLLRQSSDEAIEAYLLGTGPPLDVAVAPDGRFSTPSLSEGRYVLVARAGLTEALAYAVDLSAPVTNAALALMPTGTISGRVVTSDGSPVPDGLRVAAVLADGGKEIDALMRDTAPVRDGGAFELPGMFGERVLRVVADTQGWTLDRVTVGKQRATTIVVQPGATIANVAIMVTR